MSAAQRLLIRVAKNTRYPEELLALLFAGRNSLPLGLGELDQAELDLLTELYKEREKKNV